MSNLASPFGWEVGPLGLGGEVGGQSIFVSEFPPSTAGAVPLPPRGTAFSRAPALQSLGWVARLGAVYL